MTRIRPIIWLLTALTATAATSVVAQQPTGSVGGTVSASTGTGLPGVGVTILNSGLAIHRTVETEADGKYLIPDLPPGGGYEVEAALTGFATVVHSSVAVTAGQRVSLNFTLFAASAEALVVTGRAVTPERERSAPPQTVNEALVHSLPLVGRDFLALASLAAGFTGSPTAPSPQGQIYWSNNILVDGASHYSKWRGAARTFYSGYGLEAVREVQVLTSQFSAEYGEALAAVTIAVTNSGTNTLRGSALLFVQNGVLNDSPAFTSSKPPFDSERFGMTLGGPIVKDQTHFFGSYEGRRSRGQKIVTSPQAIGSTAANNEDEHLLFFKADHKGGARDLLTARYNGQWFRWHDEPGGLTLPGTGIHYTNDVHTLLVSDTALISNRMLNQMRFQFARYADVRTDLNPSVFVSRAGESAEGGTLGPYGFGANPEDTWEGADTLSYRRGSHGLKLGGGLKYVAAHTPALPYGRGAYFFKGPSTLYPQPFQYVQALASSEAVATADPHSTAAYAFAQDDWTVASGLTLNLGLRYDVERISNVLHYEAPTDKNNVQPRLGIAWEALPGRLVVRGGVGLYTQQHLLGYINKVQLEAPDGTATVTLTPDTGFMPVFPNTLPPTFTTLPPRDIQVADPTFRNPYSVQATIGAEHSFFGVLVGADAVYLRGKDLMSIVDTNAPASTSKLSTRSVAEADLTRPVVPTTNGFRKVISLGNLGDSWYKALQVKVSRAAGTVNTMASYTFAHAEDQGNYLLPEDSRNLPAEKARADNDIRHNLSVGLSWAVPSERRGLKDLSLSAVGVFRSSGPYTITWGDDRYGTTQNDARPGERNTATGDTFSNVDLSLVKRFHVGNVTIEARGEAFDVLSTTNYDEYVGTLSSSLFGHPVTAFPRRRIQLAAVVRF